MERRKFEIWLTDLGEKAGTEPGKIRPSVVVQSSFLTGLPSTLICPITSNPWLKGLLRIEIKGGISGLQRDSFILIEQIRALDNSKFLQLLGELPLEDQLHLNESLKIVLDLD